ncbi:MAG: transcription termination/antitermination protein NusA [Chloroflexi bacterium]|nr:transcription termination/antitermination protein NusA [Chloroflexota bacterium]
MKNDFLIAITQLSAEKNLPKEVVLEAVEAALASAFKKEVPGATPNVTVKVNPNTGEVTVYTLKTVVEEVEDPHIEMTLEEARTHDKKAQLGDTIQLETMPRNAGRIAAQTAKQVVMQRLREAEREVVFAEFAGKEGDIVGGIVTRIEPKLIVLDLGKTEAILPITEQVKTEHYRVGQRLKVNVVEVFRSGRGPQVVVSRTHRNLVRRLFEMEVPEIYNGIVEIKAIAREPGFRSKVAVAARQEGVDAVGSCVGLRGIRIQNVVTELGGEKIDVIQWDPEAAVFVANALSPAPVVSVSVNDDDKTATVVVPDRQLSLAIGREGQNARLAAKLTGWRIDIKSASIAEAERVAQAAEEAALAAEEAARAALEPAGAPPVEAEPALAPVAEAPLAVPEVEVAASVTLEPAAQLVAAPGAPPEADTLPHLAPVEVTPVLPVPEPPLAAPARIRFAEDLGLPSRGKAKKGKGKGADDGEELEGQAAKPKKAKRARPVVDEEEELDEYADLIRLPRR